MLEVEEVAAFKKQKMSVELVDGQKKLYYIHADFVDAEWNIDYSLYRLELSQLGNGVQGMPPPVLTLSEKGKYAYGVGFGALDSKIYMVGGKKYNNWTDPNTGRMLRKEKDSLDVYVFDTSSLTVTSGPPLMAPIDVNPVVIPVKGKLYVMPLVPVSGLGHRGGVRSVIQVLDPVANSWSVIQFPNLMWDTGAQTLGKLGRDEVEDVGRSPYEILGYAVKDDSVIILSLRMTLLYEVKAFFYNTETGACDLRKVFPPKIVHIPFFGSYHEWDRDSICCATHSTDGILRLQDVTLGENSDGSLPDEENGEIRLAISDLTCKHPEKPCGEDARIIEIAPRNILVVSRCWMDPLEEKWFQLRLHHLKLEFERTGKCNKASLLPPVVVKCVTLRKSLRRSDGAEPILSRWDVDAIKGNMMCTPGYCFYM